LMKKRRWLNDRPRPRQLSKVETPSKPDIPRKCNSVVGCGIVVRGGVRDAVPSGVLAMKIIICSRDGFKCDLNVKTKTCRHMNNWNGKCFSRLERKGNMTELVSVKKIHDAEKDDEPR